MKERSAPAKSKVAEKVEGSDSDSEHSKSTKVEDPQKKGCDDPEKPCGTSCTPVSRLDTGRTMMQRGQFTSAAHQFASLVAADPSDLEAAFYQSWCLMTTGRAEEFAEIERKTADLRKGSVKGTLMNSWFARSRGNLKLANQLAREALKKEQSAPCYYTAAISDENPNNAVVEIDRALKLEPDSFVYTFAKGNLLRNTHDFKSAREWLDKAARIAPNSALVMVGYGELAQQQGDAKKAVDYFQSALNMDPDLNICYVYLDLYYEKKNPADEARFYTELLNRYPNHPRTLLNRGRAYYEILDYEKASVDFEKLTEITEGVPEQKYVNALAHMFRGHEYNRTGQYQLAIEDYDIALKHYPKNIDLLLSAINMRVESLRFDEAEGLIDERLNQNSTEVTSSGGIDKRRKSILLSFKAKIRAAQSRWSEVYALANEAIKLDPTNMRAYEVRAKGYYSEKKYPQALSDYRKVNNPPSYDQRGWISAALYHMGKKKEALAVISAYIKDHPEEPMGYTTRAGYHIAFGEKAKAEADANAAVKAGVNVPAAHWALANVYIGLGKKDKAANEVIEALRNDTVASSIREKLTIAVGNMAGTEPLLIAISKKTEEEPDNAQFYFLLGTVQMMANRMDRAAQHLNRAIALNPKVGVYYVQRGILFVKTARFDEALKDLNKGLDEFKVQDPHGYSARGQVFSNIGQWGKAAGDFSQAIAGLPPDQAPYTERGTAYSHLHEDKKAIADFEKSLSQKRGERIVLLRLAPLYEGQGQFPKAIALYDRLLSLTPNELQALERRGDIYMKLNRPKDAITDYSKVLTMSNAFTGILYKRGKAYEKLGKFDLAEKDFADATGIDKDMLGPERKRKKPSLSVHY